MCFNHPKNCRLSLTGTPAPGAPWSSLSRRWQTGQMVFVKICGLRTTDAVEVAIKNGADAIGFVLSPSPRQVSAARARALVDQVSGRVMTVGVFRDEDIDTVLGESAEAGVSTIQVHGIRTQVDIARLLPAAETVIRAAPHTSGELKIGALGEHILLVDAPRAGSGESWDYGALAGRLSGDWILAGGLRPDNVAAAIRAASPWGVDVSSGVESAPGVKDAALIAQFLQQAQA